MSKHLLNTVLVFATITFGVTGQVLANSTLYTNSGGWLHTINQITGAVAQVVGCSCSAEDLSWRHGDRDYLYGVVNNTFSSSQLIRINIRNGHHELFPIFNDTAIGLRESFATGIAISRLNPNIAVVTGFDSELPWRDFGDPLLWNVDLATGAVIGAGVPLAEQVSTITFSLDGAVLYGTDRNGRLLTLDPDTGISTFVGDPGLTDFIEGLAFRPEDGALFAIDGGTADNLVILNPIDGSLVSTPGFLHFGGLHGLAFIVPEPQTALLFALFLCATYGMYRVRV